MYCTQMSVLKDWVDYGLIRLPDLNGGVIETDAVICELDHQDWQRTPLVLPLCRVDPHGSVHAKMDPEESNSVNQKTRGFLDLYLSIK